MTSEAPKPQKPQKPWLTRYRRAIFFWTGLAGLTAETVGSLVFQRTPDPSLLVLFAGMTGLPAFLKGEDGE